HCGGCFNACEPREGIVPRCIAGSCNSCAIGSAECDGVCVNVSTDANNCGTCGHRCSPGQVCSGSVCGCSGGRISCNGACIDGQSDPNNCGECSKRCNGACQGGRCL